MVSDASGPRSALRFPWGFGLLYGFLAAVAGAATTLAVIVVDWSGLPPRLGALTLRMLYEAHGVGVAGPPPVVGPALPGAATALVPVVVLTALGYAHAGGYVGTSAQQAVLAGASIAVGYVAAALAGVLLGVRASPLAAIVAFGGYALVFGGLGGYLARSRS
ncbi:MAG: hypothetical protein ABEJ68_11680 [Halobacteriaceae archaeon]